MEGRILSVGLELAMEFGKNWLQPIQSRLARRFPELSSADLDAYDRACGSAMRNGHSQVLIQWRRAGGKAQEARRLFDEIMLTEYPWMTSSNLTHLFSQGCYYAAKDGELT